MSTLSNVSSTDAIRAFQKLGWRVSRQAGSHIILTREGSAVNLSVPNRSESAKGTLRTLIRNAGMTVDEFLALL